MSGNSPTSEIRQSDQIRTQYDPVVRFYRTGCRSKYNFMGDGMRGVDWVTVGIGAGILILLGALFLLLNGGF